MKIACVIPARLKSVRFPGKVLVRLGDKPLLQWVWEAASSTGLFDTVTIAVDALETAELVKSFGGHAEMTSETCNSGTERLIELYRQGKVQADIWVNWQGDEPFIDKEMIQQLLQTCREGSSDVWTLKKRIETAREIQSPQIAKVVCDAEGYALYFSRSAIPFYRDGAFPEEVYKHIGIYAYTAEALGKIDGLPKNCPLEEAEKLEQLRFLYHRFRVQVHETHREVLGIDLPEHLEAAECRLSQYIK